MQQPDTELWAAMTQLQALCERRGIDLVAAARVPGAATSIAIQVGALPSTNALVQDIMGVVDQEVAKQIARLYPTK